MDTSRICPQNLRSYLSSIGSKDKVTRIALPIIAFGAVCLALAYYLRTRLVHVVPSQVVPLMYDPVHFTPTPTKIDGYSSQPYKIPLSRIYPGTSLDYILAETPRTDTELTDFLELVSAKAGIVISFGSSSLSSRKIEASDQITWAEKFERNCLLRKYSISDPSSSSVKTVYHLIFDVLPPSVSFSLIRIFVDDVNNLMKAQGIDLQGKPVIVSATNEYSGLFILIHQLDHHVTRLLEESLRKNPHFTAAELARNILNGINDDDVLSMLNKRSNLIGEQAGLNVTTAGFAGRMSDNFITQSKVTSKYLAREFMMYVMSKAQEMVSSTLKQFCR